MKYNIGVREVWVQQYEVEADSPEQAKQLIEDGEALAVEEDGFEFSHNLPKEHWVAIPIPKHPDNGPPQVIDLMEALKKSLANK